MELIGEGLFRILFWFKEVKMMGLVYEVLMRRVIVYLSNGRFFVFIY